MAVELLTNVIIGGQVTAGFNAMAGKLQSMGAIVDRIGSKVREFEKESVETYRTYEDNMLAAQYALMSRYESTSELTKVMQSLDEYASSWASTTIFHTSDVSKAILEAARAGWDYTKIVKGIPRAMQIAQAGGMDLSSGLDYLIKMMNTTGTSFDDMGTLIDQWAKAANLSATSIDEMGEAFMSLSASAMFADNTQELFTMLAVLANAGVTGSKAGTLIRNAMMRVIAPTDKAKAAMKKLGAEEEELANWTGASDTAKQLQKLGFSAYDQAGNLKPMRDILKSLHDSISGMTEQGRYDILSSIFPLRSINAATAFYNAMESGEWDKLFVAIGDSEGYAAKGSEIMMSGLTGAIETLSSKWEEFQRQVGELMAPALEKISGFLGTIMDGLNNMDEGQMSALVGALSTLATIGPGLLITGLAIKLFTTLGPWGTAFLLAAVGAGALVGYLTKMSEINFKSNFGTMQVDLDSLGKHVDSLKTKFDTQVETIATWEAALASAETTYADQASKMSELLLQDVLEGKTLSPTDKEKIYAYAGELVKATQEGIQNAETSDLSFLQLLFGDRSTDEEEDVYNLAAQLTDARYEGLYAEAYSIGQTLRAQMTAALRDGTLDEGERQAIQATTDRLNQINAAIAASVDREAFLAQLYKAQRVSWDSIADYIKENEGKMTEELARHEDLYDIKKANYRAAYEEAAKNGTEVTDLHGNKIRLTQENMETYWSQFETEFNRERADTRQGIIDKYGQLNAAAFDSLMNDSDFSMGWKYLKWMQENGVGLYNTDEYGNRETNWEGLRMNPALAAVLSEQLINLANNDSSWGGLGKGKLTDLLKPYADNPLIAGYLAMLNNAFEVGTTATSYMNRYDSDVEGAQSSLTDLQKEQLRLENEIAAREARMESGYSVWDTVNGRNYHSDWVALYGQNGEGGGLYDQKAKVDMDVQEAEAKLKQLQDEAAKPASLPVIADLDTSAVDSWIPPIKRMPVLPGGVTQGLFAEGGRATQPSIFGEAGAEWAIPEAHTDRTAELLNAARQASGFSWGDLLSRFGGLNANPDGRSLVVNYSPTINAGNSDGVEQVLANDKSRLLRLVRQMLDDMRTRDEVEVYA